MEAFNNFIETVFSKQSLLIFLIVLLVLIFVIVFLLIKLQYSMNKNENENDENELDIAFNNKEEQIENEHVDKKLEVKQIEENVAKETFKEQKEKEQSLEELLNSEFDNISETKKTAKSSKADSLSSIDSIISEMENKDDESSAIISNKELANKQNTIKEELGFDNETIIKAYEDEQEKKAIISYDELLKNAKALRETFKIPDKEEKENIKISKVEVETTELHVTSYIVEEEFLNTLKKFRLNLK